MLNISKLENPEYSYYIQLCDYNINHHTEHWPISDARSLDINTWCEENLSGKFAIGVFHTMGHDPSFSNTLSHFELEADMILFKLMWGHLI